MIKRLDFWLLAVVFLAVILRLPLLNGSFWLDEAAQALESSRPLAQQLSIASDFQPPLLHLLLHFATYLSSAEWWLRTVGALIPGLLTSILTYQLSKELFSKHTAIITSLMLATSSFHIFYSQELRPYSLPAFFAVLGWYAVYKLTSNYSAAPKLIWVWLGVLLGSGILGLYSSYLYPFLLLSQFVYLSIFAFKKIGLWLGSGLAIFAAFTPWIPSFLEQLRVGQSWRANYPGWEQVVSYDQIKSLALTFGKFLFGVIDLELSLPFLALTVLILGCIGYLKWQYFPKFFSDLKKRKLAKLRPKLLVLIWLFLPLALAWIVSWWIPVIQPKRVLFLLPAFYLVLVQISLAVPSKFVKQFFIGLLLLINLFGTYRYFTQAHLQRENWRELHTLLLQRYPSKQTVAVFAFDEPFAPWRWYDQGRMATLTTGQLVVYSLDQITSKLKYIHDFNYVITFEYLADLSDPNRVVPQFVQEQGFVLIDTLTYPLIGRVQVWSTTTSSLSLESSN